MQLKDQVALVTGGGRGIGRAIAKAYAGEGAKVAIVYRGSKDAAEALVQEIQQARGTAMAFQADVADFAAAKGCVEQVLKTWEQVDILVNNAGTIKDGLFLQMEPSAWDTVLQTNLGGVFNFCRAVVEAMFRRRRGRIINISSVAADRVNRGQANYSAAKAGLVADTRTWADELAPYGIRTGAIAPGLIETPILQGMPPDELAKLGEQVPLGRLGKPAEIFQAVKFILECDYFTGRCIDVDGGLKM